MKVELDSELLSGSTKVKCLEEVIDDKLSWKDQVNTVRRKAYGGVSELKWLHNVLPTGLKKKLYNVLVLPHFEHCSVVWQRCLVEL